MNKVDGAMRGLITANTETLEQVLSLINAAQGAAYNDVAEGMTSSLGCHVRHVLDHYTALQVGVKSGLVDYDKRSRDSEVETNAELAIEKVNELIAWLSKNIATDVKLKMKSEISATCLETITMDSSLQRELIYLLNHTVHHMAQVSLALRIMGITINDQIGIAPATLTHLRNSEIRQAS